MLSPSLVILSEAKNLFQLALRVNSAKHLQYLVGDKQMQILRCAQNDMVGGFLISLLGRSLLGGAALENFDVAVDERDGTRRDTENGRGLICRMYESGCGTISL